jgi:hypothetical protein
VLQVTSFYQYQFGRLFDCLCLLILIRSLFDMSFELGLCFCDGNFLTPIKLLLFPFDILFDFNVFYICLYHLNFAQFKYILNLFIPMIQFYST